MLMNPQVSSGNQPQTQATPAQAMQANQPAPTPVTPTATPAAQSQTPATTANGASQQPQDGKDDKTSPIVKQLQQHLNSIPDAQKQFLAEHLTPEFVQAIGIINGPEVANYLNQFADPNKVMVPVPRAVAEQYMQQQQGQQPGQQPSGNSAPQNPATQPSMQQAQPQQQPAQAPQGMMSPSK